ncbi:hypothetical protein JCM3766R1_006558 [Sporobolomyces carnicolor]
MATTSTGSVLSQAIATTDSADKELLLRQILDQPAGPRDEDLLKDKESAILELGKLYRDQRDATKLAQVVKDSRPLVEHLAKAKTAKLIRTLLDYFEPIPDSRQVRIDATVESAEWAKQDKRIFLKQSLETRLVGLYLDDRQYKPALELITQLLRELKKLDDKMILTEVHLLESKVHYSLVNMPKAKAALVSARTAANSIYCPPLLQAQLDLQSGVLHAEEKDYKTAYSYFFEAFEGLSSQEDEKSVLALKYMLLCKIMLGLSEDVSSILNGKLAQKYAGNDTRAMKLVAQAHKDRSLSDFERLLQDHKSELSDDPIIRNHLSSLYDTLLEQNLVRIIEPFSRVEIQHVAELVKQPVREVENKLSQMILDKVFHGILDQGAGCLIVFDEPEVDKAYDTSLETIGHVSQVVEQLFQRTRTAVI